MSNDDFEEGFDDASDEGRFFDLTAAESGDEQEDLYKEMNYYVNDLPSRGPRPYWNEGSDGSFDQFTRLPVEIQQIIWEFFCPDLTAKVRVFNLTAMPISRSEPGCFWESAALYQQTAPARALLALDRQRRGMALRSFPDTLPIRRRGEVIRFDRTRDIIDIDTHTMSMPNIWPKECDRIVSLALSVQHFLVGLALEDVANTLTQSFPHLKTLYVLSEDEDFHKNNALMWCLADEAQRYYVKTVEEEPGLGEDLEFMYCWPDFENHRDFASKEANPHALLIEQDALGRLVEDLRDEYDYTEEEVQQMKSLEVWPMIRFAFGSGLSVFDGLAAAREAGHEGPLEEESSEGESEEDEYESSGIDDAEIDDEEGSDEEDDLVVVSLSGDEDESEAGSEGQSAQFEGFSDAAADGGLVPARFSSSEPEPDAGVVLKATDSDAESDEAPARVIKRGSRRVVSSDSEDDGDEEEGAEAVTVKAKANVKRRTRVVASESGDDEDEISGGLIEKSPSGDEDKQESSESEDEAPRKRQTLAERLQLHREENPIDLDADSDNDDGEGGYEIENSNEDDESEDDSEGGHGLVDDLAEESDDEGDEDGEGW